MVFQVVVIRKRLAAKDGVALSVFFPAFERVPHLAKTLPALGDNVAEHAGFWETGGLPGCRFWYARS